MVAIIYRALAALSRSANALRSWAAPPEERREPPTVEPGAEQLSSQVAELHELVHGYQDLLADVSRSLGLQTRIMIESGEFLRLSDEGSFVELKSELKRRLSDVLDRNQNLQTELQAARDQLRVKHAELAEAKSESRIDHLTQVPNRRAFEEKIASLHAEFERYDRRYSLAIFDVDHFKAFNDTYGHPAGDAMLRTIAKAASGMLRTSDFLARVGGEEFAILFPGASLTQCRKAVERYRRTISSTKLRIGGQRLTVTASFGAATPEADESVSQFIARTDEALYLAKNSGRNQICLHSGERVESIDDLQECAMA